MKTKMTEEDIAIKHKLLTKLGRPLYYGPTMGVCLRVLPDNIYRCSFSASGVNWVDEVHIDKLSTEGAGFAKVSTKGEVYEKEDAGCEGGACKI